jgi:hypothetical protein
MKERIPTEKHVCAERWDATKHSAAVIREKEIPHQVTQKVSSNGIMQNQMVGGWTAELATMLSTIGIQAKWVNRVIRPS